MRVRLIIIFCLMLSVLNSYTQTKNIDILKSHELSKYYYIRGDYLNAYKYLLIYKYSNLDSLINNRNQSLLESVDASIKYCEDNIKSGLSQFYIIKAKGFTEPIDIDSLNRLILARAPKLF